MLTPKETKTKLAQPLLRAHARTPARLIKYNYWTGSEATDSSNFLIDQSVAKAKSATGDESLDFLLLQANVIYKAITAEFNPLPKKETLAATKRSEVRLDPPRAGE